MPKHNFDLPKGTIEVLEIESKALTNNILGDPTKRAVALYLPQNYVGTSKKYPLFVDLAGFTGSGFGHLSWKAFQETCLLYTSPSPRDLSTSRMPSSA